MRNEAGASVVLVCWFAHSNAKEGGCRPFGSDGGTWAE